MVKIRLARGGSKKNPVYCIVVTDSKNARNGSFIEKIGVFNPMELNTDKGLCINFNKVKYWLSKGAKPSDRVFSLIKNEFFKT